MRVIKKKISLEPYRSRIPGILDSFEGDLYMDFYTDNSNKYNGTMLGDSFNLKESSKSNYGLFPNTVTIPKTLKNSVLSGKTLSYPTLHSIFNFYKTYFELLNTHTCNGKQCDNCETYQNAVEYFKNEEQSINNLSYFQALDELFEKYGGKKTYEFISKFMLLQVEIPTKFIEKWGCSHLYHTEIFKWHSWFKERNAKYNGKECSETEDCCDCKEYEERGGYLMFSILDTFIKNLSFKNYGVDTYDDIVYGNGFTNQKSFKNIACINIPILITNSIDDLGEMSIFSEEWEGGKDFDTIGKTKYQNGKTIVSYNGDAYIATNPQDEDYSYGTKGNEYEEYIFNDDVFKQYFYWVQTSKNVDKETKDEFIKNNKSIKNTFAYNKNGKIVLNPSLDNMYITYTKKGGNGFFINRQYYSTTDIDIVLFNLPNIPLIKQVVIVNYDATTPQIRFNNKVISGYRKRSGNAFKWCFKYNNKEFDITKKKGIIIGRNVYLLDANHRVQFDDIQYDELNGYFTVSGNTLLVNKGNKLCSPSEIKNGVQTYDLDNISLGFYGKNLNKRCYEIKDDKLFIYTPFTEYRCDKISGYTESKLSLFDNEITITDSIGERISGLPMMNEKSEEIYPTYKNHQTYIVDLPYRVGSLAKSNTPLINKDGKVLKTKDKSYWWGSIISQMSFYYTDIDGKKITDTEVVVKLGDKWSGVDSYIKKSKQLLDSVTDFSDYGEKYDKYRAVYNGLDETIKCDIEYYVGCSLLKNLKLEDSKVISNFSLTNKNDKYHIEGIKYIETVSLELDTAPYHTDIDKFFLLNYYKVNRDKREYISNDFSNTPIECYYAKFEYEPSFIHSNINEDNDYELIVKDNDASYFPTFREEYKIGSSSVGKVEGDIYISRGVAQCFDKHLKLMQVKTMEAMEQYGNGYFKLIENK